MKKKRLSYPPLRKFSCGKILSIMKLSLVLIFAAVISASASVDVMSQMVSLDFKDAELSEVLRDLKSQTGHMIVYSADKVQADNIRVSMTMKNVSLERALEALLKDLPYEYAVEDGSVLIIPAPGKLQQAPPQTTVTGRVTDTGGNPLVGVTVVVQGTAHGVATDADGQFTLRFPQRDGAILRFSFVGMLNVDIPYTGQTELTVRMENAASDIDEVVVTGYQTIAREKVTGATTTVTADDLSSRHTTNVLDNLEGRIAGLVNYGGKLTIRGTSSLFAETKPLLVIDGLPVEGDLEDLNPYDIESITVLKDAAAAAIYGARASNGIIVIATKKATTQNKIDIEVSANMTVYQKKNVDYADNFYLTPAQQVDLESDYYRWYYNDAPAAADNLTTTGNMIAGTTSGGQITPVQYAYWQLANGTINETELNSRLAQYRKQNFAADFADRALRNRMLQQYNVAVRNRTDNFQSNLVFNYKRDNMGIKHANENQLNIFYKGSYDMTRWMTINFSVNTILQHSNESNSRWASDPFNVPAYYNLMEADGSYASHIPASTTFYNDYSTFADDSEGLRSMRFNHVEELALDRTKTERQSLRYHGELLFKVIDGLTFNTQFIYQTDRFSSDSYSEAESFIMRWLRNVYTERNATTGQFTYLIPEYGGKLVGLNEKGNAWTGRAQVNFNRVFRNDHSIDLLAGMEFRETLSEGGSNIYLGWDDQLQSQATTLVNYTGLTNWRTTYFVPGMYAYQYAYQPYIRDAIAPVQERRHRNASAYANLTYTYKERYNLFGSIRKDYGDIFGLAARFRGSPFLSVGASWNIDREEFMQGIGQVNTLKLRASYGSTGNIHQEATSYMTANTRNRNSITGLPMAVVESPGDADLSWEITNTLNFGVDFSMFEHRLRGTLDWYDKKSSKVFSAKTLESTWGFTSQVMNIADLMNRGFELSIAWDWFRPVEPGGFSWTTSMTASWNKNEVTAVEIQARTAAEMLNIGYREGSPVNSLFSYVFDGLTEDGVQSWRGSKDPETGEYAKVVGVGIQSSKPDVLVFSGQADPKHTYAMENHLAWKGLSLNVMAVYYGGHKMRVRQVQAMVGNPYATALGDYYANAWTPTNTETIVPGIGEHNHTGGTQPAVQDNTDIFVQKADFLKIRNIVLGYDLPRNLVSRIGLDNLSLRFQIDNPAPLWTKNDVGVDPETLGLRRQTSYIFGLNFRF